MPYVKLRRVSVLCTLCWLISSLATSALPPISAAPSLASNQPSQLPFLGLNTYFTGLERIMRDGDDGMATLMASGRAMNASWGREELSWGNIERSGKGRWDWNPFDQRLHEMAESGYGIIGMLLTTPKWARVSDCAARIKLYSSVGVQAQDFWCPPANVQDYADYVRVVVERYDGDGIDDAPGSPRIAAWQLWNEPNAWETWPGSPAEYGALMVAGYNAAKAADPTAVVATGGLYVLDGGWNDGRGHSDGLRFLGEALDAVPAAANAFDALAIHPYMPDVAPDQPGILSLVTLGGRISTARNWLRARVGERPLWISEIGWSTCTSNQPDCFVGLASGSSSRRLSSDSPASFDDERWPMANRPTTGSPGIAALIGKSEDQQANYMVRSALIAQALGVRHLSYFQFEDKFDGQAGNFWEEASVVHTKAEGYAPKLAYGAYRTLVEQLGGAAFVGAGALHTYSYDPATQRNPAARYHLRFVTADNILIDVLWQTGSAQSVRLALDPGRSATLVSRDGVATAMDSSTGTVDLRVSEAPIYLRQSLPRAMSIMPSEITVLAAVGSGPQYATLHINNSGSGSISWLAGSDMHWVKAVTAAGAGYTSTLTIQINPSGLPVGNYSATITVISDVGTQNVPMRLMIVPQIWNKYFPISLH